MTSAAGPGSSPDPRVLDDLIVQEVAAQHRALIEERGAQLAGIAPEAEVLVASLQQYLAGGKLLRPRFCFFGGLTALSGPPTPEQVTALARCGAAIELVQAAALMHDDVIDHSPTRRGRPAMHEEHAAVHRASDLDGSAEEFGVAVAIVLGDLTLSWAEDLFTAALDGTDPSLRARAEFDALRTEVMTGQYLDILHQAGGLDSNASGDAEAAALAVIRWKTVPYTVLRPVRMGAALMGADDEALELLSRWAIEVGTAFQLRDDLLSVVGDEDSTGKPTGGDIVEGKRTVLLARTQAQAGEAEQALLRRTVGVAQADPADVQAVHDLMVRTGAVRSVAEDVRERARAAQALLEGAEQLGPVGRAGLARLAEHATDTTQLPG